MRTIFATSATFLLATAAIVSGCALKHNDNGAAVEAVIGASDSNDTESNVEAMSTSFVGSSGSSGTVALSLNGSAELSGSGDVVAQTLGDAAKAFYVPAGCLTGDQRRRRQPGHVFICRLHRPLRPRPHHGDGHRDVLLVLGEPAHAHLRSDRPEDQRSDDQLERPRPTSRRTARPGTMVWTGMFNGTTGSRPADLTDEHEDLRLDGRRRVSQRLRRNRTERSRATTSRSMSSTSAAAPTRAPRAEAKSRSRRDDERRLRPHVRRRQCDLHRLEWRPHYVYATLRAPLTRARRATRSTQRAAHVVCIGSASVACPSFMLTTNALDVDPANDDVQKQVETVS